MNLAIGDLVCVLEHISTQTTHLRGKIGCVKWIRDSQTVGVEFNENIGGHDLEGNSQQGYGYWFTTKSVIKMEPLPVLIRKQWAKEWEPKLKMSVEKKDLTILLEE